MTLRTGYGTATFGSSKYGLPEVYEGQVSDSIAASVTVAGERIALGAATVEAVVSPVVVGVRAQNGLISDISSVSATAVGFTALAGAATSTSSVSVDLYWNRVRPFAAQDSIAIGANVNSRYKWIDIAPPSTTWVAADYREGAA
jgi:hypothetical protein